MRLRPSRLGIGDYLAGAGGLVLLVDLFALPWYQVKLQFRGALLLVGQGFRASGWQTFMWIGPLCLLVGILALAMSWSSLTRASPALAIVIAIVLSPLSLLLTLALAVRVSVAVPTVQLPAGAGAGLQTCAGAYIGLVAAALIAAGAWLALRRDGVDPADAPAPIETVRLGAPRLSDAGPRH
jgi:hypothetical protein